MAAGGGRSGRPRGRGGLRPHDAGSERSIRTICERAKYLAASTPANAANLGYHTISKYPRADYLCLAEHDLRLDRRSSSGDLPQLLEQVTQMLQARRSAVTTGSKGCLCYAAEVGFVQVPALATRVVDRFGAE